MIKIKKIGIDDTSFKASIIGMRNPMNSWSKSDSEFDSDEHHFTIGENDLKLMKNLSKSGPEHAKYKRMINVYLDIDAPLYWWKEFDTYKIGTVANSCSTMHKIHSKEFIFEDFSCEHLIDPDIDVEYAKSLEETINKLNKARELYLETKDKKYWWIMIQLLPSSYNQHRTVMLNYETLTNIYKQRNNHKLDEWRMFCGFVKEFLPYSELITNDN